MAAGADLLLPADDAHHLINVLRLKQGAKITVVDTNFRCAYPAELFISDSPHAKISGDPFPAPTMSRIASIIPALTKRETSELVVDWSVELGAQNILLWQSDRSIIRMRTKDDVSKKLERFRKQAASAAKQSKQIAIPQLSLSSSLEEMCRHLNQIADADDIFLLCSLEKNACPIMDALNEKPWKRAHLVIGPEGDLTLEEISHLVSLGFKPVSLGESTLRSELAVVTAMTAINLFSQWKTKS